MKRWGKRFFSSTRGQVVKLLRRGQATVNDLAEALGLTDNAVRSHLATLERDGLVREAGKRPGVRKPETVYALASDAELLFPKAYHLLLNRLLTSLGDRMSPAEIDALLREVGRSLAEAPSDSESVRDRSEKALGILEELGGLAELRETDEGLVIHGYSCPLADSVREHPEVCKLAEALLQEIIQAPVTEICDRKGTPRCVFRIHPT